MNWHNKHNSCADGSNIDDLLLQEREGNAVRVETNIITYLTIDVFQSHSDMCTEEFKTENED